MKFTNLPARPRYKSEFNDTTNRATILFILPPGYDGPVAQWFGWKLQCWNSNRDTIHTYIAVIRTRLSEGAIR